MIHTEITNKIKEVLVEEFEVEVDQIRPEANLQQTLALDSLDYIDLVVLIENTFAFKVKQEDFTRIFTFRDFYDYVINRVHSKEFA